MGKLAPPTKEPLRMTPELATITMRDIYDIHDLLHNGVPTEQVCDEYGLSWNSVKQIGRAPQVDPPWSLEWNWRES